MSDLSKRQHDIHSMAVDKGWWDDVPVDAYGCVQMTTDQILAKLALIHSEVSEATECVRSGEMETDLEADGKPVGFATELADVVIRCLDLAGAMNIDLGELMATKVAYNATRTHRHGGKLA